MVPIRKSFQTRSISVGEDLATLLLIILMISILDKVKNDKMEFYKLFHNLMVNR